MKSLFKQLKITSAAILALTLTLQSYPGKQTVAQQAQEQKTLMDYIEINLEPTNRGQPTSTSSTGRRGGGKGACRKLEPPLIALVPLSQKSLQEGANKESRYEVSAQTIESHPIFWFYLPKLDPRIQKVEFHLFDEEIEDIMQQPLPIDTTQTPAIIGFRLPKDKASLAVNSSYFWSIKVICDAEETANNPSVAGFITRVAPETNLNKELETATAREKVSIYARNNLWQEAFTTLALLRQDDLEDEAMAEAWLKLLQYTDFNHSKIADETNIFIYGE